MFYVNREELFNEDGSLKIDMVSKYINYFQTKYQNTYKVLEEAYNRKLTDDVVVNLQKYIVDTITSYTFGKAIQYQNVSEDYLNNMTAIDEDGHNINLARQMSIYGKGYEFLFADEEEGINLELSLPTIIVLRT